MLAFQEFYTTNFDRLNYVGLRLCCDKIVVPWGTELGSLDAERNADIGDLDCAVDDYQFYFLQGASS